MQYMSTPYVVLSCVGIGFLVGWTRSAWKNWREEARQRRPSWSDVAERKLAYRKPAEK